jgi:branched-chain amino acid transport system permease protein
MAPPLVGVALALGLPLVVYPTLALDIVLWSLFAVAVNLLLGFGGLLSFGHAAFWGTGGYTAGILAKSFAFAYPLAAIGGAFAAAVLALPIGYLSVRRRGIYFAMVTLAFAQMVFYVVNEWRDVTGGENGLQSIPRTFPGIQLGQPLVFYYAALPLALLGFWLAHRVVHSPFGHVLVAIRDNEARAQALGYRTHRYKVLAFVLTAALSGLAGSLYSLGHGFAALELGDWRTSGIVVMMVILGGIGTFWGSVIGAALVLLLRDWLSTWTDAWGVVTGIIFVIVVLSFRRGIWGTLVRASTARRRPKPRPEAAKDVEPDADKLVRDQI